MHSKYLNVVVGYKICKSDTKIDGMGRKEIQQRKN